MQTGPVKPTANGSCLCGAVQFEVHGPLRDSIACHCSQCRKSSGHYWSATRCLRADLRLVQDSGLAWYRSSEHAQRGFCRHCGSSLFWQLDDNDHTSIGTGTLDTPTGLKTLGHIFVKDRSDYVEIASGSPQWHADRDEPPIS